MFRLAGGLRSQVSGTTRGSQWHETTLTVNASGIEMHADKADADITLELSLWGQARTTVNVTDPYADIPVRHASRRQGADLASFGRVRVRNRWDLPRSAAGTPFEFDGPLGTLELIREHNTLCRTTVHGSRQPQMQPVQGYALENFYLHVKPPSATAVVGSGSVHTRLTEGHALLLFDVRMAQPMLPDPYAANWVTDALDESAAEMALSALLSWVDGHAPALRSQLRSPVASPYPVTDSRCDHQRFLPARHVGPRTPTRSGAFAATPRSASHRQQCVGVAAQRHQAADDAAGALGAGAHCSQSQRECRCGSCQIGDTGHTQPWSRS